jgi:uncharacterized protein
MNFNIELDLEKIKKLGQQKEDKNFKFRAFLKGKDSDKTDEIVHRLNAEISAKIDCTSCGNCCVELKPPFTAKEIEQVSQRLNISSGQFKEKYTEFDEGKRYIKDIPCSFLDGKKCSIYDIRPKDCKTFPYLQKDEFTSRLFGVIDNYSICPIVFNVYEQLKIHYNFR